MIGTSACGSEVFPLQVEPQVTSEVSMLSLTCPSASFSLSVMEDDFPPHPSRAPTALKWNVIEKARGLRKTARQWL